MIQNLKIMTRLGLMIGIMTLALLLTVAMGFYGMSIGVQGIDDVYHGGVVEMKTLISARDVLQAAKDAKNTNEAYRLFDEDWGKYLTGVRASGVTQEQQGIIDRIESQIKVVKNETKAGPAIDLLSSEILSLIHWHEKVSQMDYEKAHEDISRNQLYTIIVFGLALLFAILTALWIAFNITRPLGVALDFINKLAIGDLDFEVPHTTKDEVGQLLNATKTLKASSKKMSDDLTAVSKGDLTINSQQRSDQDTLGVALFSMLKNLRHIVGGLQSEVATLTSSSQEIVGSVSQVATGSAETAAAVAETTSSVEELKQTAHLSDEKAKDVLKSAEETMEIVTASEKSLQITLDDMEHINDKMRIISSGIVKLSEHSQTIREIIDTVNDLAEQSNLLAVNAAIEAAKAGEHGKSFAVVAQEIRTLAEQSKAATIQVRSILNDIQNATSEAVLATEQGSKAVEKGVGQSIETRECMQKLNQSMSQVAKLASEIVDSSQQQLTGVDQVTVAMGNISDAASQHVDNMKQIETAVISMNSVGETLKDIITQYTLSKDTRSKERING